MTAYPVCELLDKLGVARSYSRPRVSNDNPYSESAFKTLKYQPTFPERFGSTEDARAFFATYFDWYNNIHRHSGIRMLTPAAVHLGLAADLLEKRYAVMQRAYDAHPDRFAAGSPSRVKLPSDVWINQPSHDGTAAA